jgi:hypothetical protein
MTREELVAAYQAYLALEASKPAEGTDAFPEWCRAMDEAHWIIAWANEVFSDRCPEGATIQ